tara:strand:- start:502 stop:819 length:318 start_codon:yes stop_codon:yes gene_type:complete
MRIKNLEGRVRSALNNYPPCRDNDAMLTSILWTEEVGPDKLKSMTAWEFLTLHSRNELINARSVRRCRQKLQEHNEDLRGEKWEARQRHSKKVEAEIKNWNGKLF